MIILPINDAETLQKVHDAANADGEVIFWPSHSAIEDGVILGAFALESPISGWWMHKEKASRRQSLQMFNAMEALHADKGNLAYMMPCLESSPFFKLMTSSGKYVKLPETVHLFLRNMSSELNEDA